MAAAMRSSMKASVAKAAPAARPVALRAAPACNALQKAGQVAAGVAASSLLLAQGALASNLTKDEFNSLTYLQVKGTGVANTCATVSGDETELKIPSGTYNLEHLCLEPTSFTVKEEGSDEFVGTKLMTRLTYTLDEVSGKATVGSDGKFAFKEEDGIDYAATTVQLPGGERVPFLFTVKDLVATGSTKQFGGDFNVPSYRGSSFLDPKGRGGSTGYENAVALPGAGAQEELEGENVKSTATLSGSIVFSVAKVDSDTKELAGVFESIQPSDTDLGSKTPKDVKIQGLWYAQLE